MKRAVPLLVCGIFLAGCGGSGTSPTTQTPPNYTVRAVTQTNDDWSVVGVNNTGQVLVRRNVIPPPPAPSDGVGPSHTDPNELYLWSEGAGLASLSGLGYVQGINDDGQVIGITHTGKIGIMENGNITEIPSPAGANSVFPRGINSQGWVLASVSMPNRQGYYAIWKNGTLHELEGLAINQFDVTAMNDLGHVVGTQNSAPVHGDLAQRAFLYWNGDPAVMGTLGGKNSAALDLNDLGQFVGYADTASYTYHAFMSTGNGMKDLGTLDGMPYSKAESINNLGQVVGFSASEYAYYPNHSHDTGHAVLWMGDKSYDLNDLIPDDSGWILNTAHSINDSGQIAGLGTYHGEIQVFLLTPTE